jgi:arabinogalactan oligomer/maltooligosaccharide transport system substrate-binding protein
MDENHKDTTESKPIVTEGNSTLSSLSPPDQRGTEQHQNNRIEDTFKHSKDRGYKATGEYRRDTPGRLLKVSVEHLPRDWWQLLIIPLLIFLLGSAFTLVQYLTSQGIANNQQQETILQTYLDDMSNLLLTQHLSTSKPGEVVREVARERTLTALRRLHDGRNKIVLQFLQEAHLIGIQNAVINLSNADLSNDDLSGADLSGIDLSGTILHGATLNDADLNGAILSEADLSGAFLNRAILSGAHLDDAFLNGAILSEADLNGAFLNDTDLSGAHLGGAFLNGAFLGEATLNGAFLNDADLSYAILSGADLSYTTLNGARNLTQKQLKTVYSCTNAMLSTGLTCPHSRSVVTLTYWYTEGTAETPVIRGLIKQFRQQNPNIRIKAVNKPFLPTQAAFITAAQAGNAPDILRSDIGWVTQFASQRYLLPIDSYVSQSDRSDYLSVPLSYDWYNGHLYGLPQVTDFLALLYNKAEFAKVGITSPPATMADFKAAAMKVVQSKAATYGFETTGTSYYVLPFLWAFGGGMIDQHNHILVNNAGSVAGLNFLLKLQNSDQVMPAKVDFSNGYNNMVNDFKSGQTAMIFDGPFEVSNILTGSAFTGNPSNLGIAGIPTGSGGQTGSPVGGQSYVISAGTTHPAEAYKFISFMSSTASQVAIANANHTLPTRQSAYQGPGVSSDPVIKAFYHIRNTAVARPAIPAGGYLFDAFDSNIQAALDGAENTTDALNVVADV